MRELSPDNPYYLPQYRYLEIKNFALQYDYWKEQLSAINILGSAPSQAVDHTPGDPVMRAVFLRDLYVRNMNMVEEAAKQTDPVLGYFVLLGATKGYNYTNLNLVHGMPCSRDIYYKMLRRFYFILSGFRN